MIEQYWREVFGKYETAPGKFDIPGFPEPLMSKHFGVKNIIDGEVTGHRKLWLCEFEPYLKKEEATAKVQSLSYLNDEFWKFHNLPFLERLIPFLQSTGVPHFHFYLEDGNGICTSAIAGEGRSSVFLFNLLVKEDRRGKGYARTILKEIRAFFWNKKCFYWTLHKDFYLGGTVKPYLVKM